MLLGRGRALGARAGHAAAGPRRAGQDRRARRVPVGVLGRRDLGKGGLYSKYLLDAIGSGQADINGDSQISLKELDEWVRPRVQREARKANREQTPTVQLGKKLGASDEFIVAWGYAK